MDRKLQEKITREILDMLPATARETLQDWNSKEEENELIAMSQIDKMSDDERNQLPPSTQIYYQNWKNKITKEIADSKYATMRKTYIKNNYPNMYLKMKSEDTLLSHLANVQENMERAVKDTVLNKALSDKQFIQAVKDDDFAIKVRLFGMIQAEAEQAMGDLWIRTEVDE